MFNIYELTIAFLFLLLAAYWWRISGQTGHALAKAKQYCKDVNLQLLDQTLVFKEHRIEKDFRGKRHLGRVYEFDFCNNDEERYKGQIVLVGFNVLRIIVEHDYLEVTEY